MAILAMSIPAAGHALGLGDIAMKSSFYQPLDAQIELLSVGDVNLNNLQVKLGSKEDFQRIDVARTFFLTKIKFEVVNRKDGTAYIQLTTPQNVTEPFLNFVVEANWPQGRILREFTVLVDLPVLSDEAPAPVQQAAVAPQAAPTVTRRPPAPAAPHATTQSHASTAPVSRHASELTYGPVKNNETLYEIADAMRPRGITVDQMMLALVRNNPEAFYNGNVNRLKAGFMLRIEDPSELSAYSVADAKAEINRQHTEWQARKSSKPVRQADVPTDDRVAHSKDTGASKGDGQPRLRLVASGSVGAGSGANDRTVDQLREDLLLAEQELDAIHQENVELRLRLAEMVGELKAMHQFILRKDNETQVLQAQSGAVSAQAAAETLAEDSATTAEVEMLAEDKEAAPAPAAAAPMEVAGLLDDPLVMYGGPAVLLFIIVAVMIQRRHRMQDGYKESILYVDGEDDNVDVAADSMDGGESSMVSDSAMSNTSGMSGIETDAADVDPISEADVSQADDIPNKELENESECDEFEVSLSDLFADDSAEALKEELEQAKTVDPEQPAAEEFLLDNETSEPDIEESPEIGEMFAEPEATTSSDVAAKEAPAAPAEEEDINLYFDIDDIDSDDSAEKEEIAPAIETDVVDIDPVSKAYVYMAYGRHQQAENILNEVLEKEPERHEIKLKLLEVYFAARNRESFEQLAQDFHDALGDESDPMWSRVVTMGAQLCPGSDLFAGDSAEALKEEPGEADAVESEQAAGEEFSMEIEASELDIKESPDNDAGPDIDSGDIDETEGLARHRKYKM